MLVLLARERTHMFHATTNRFHRKICASRKKLGMLAAIVERPIDRIQFNVAVLACVEEFTGEPDNVRAGSTELRLEPIQQLTTVVVIDRPPVIRIDQAEVPQFSALVEVWHAWHCELEES